MKTKQKPIRASKPITKITLQEVRNYLDKIQIKPKNGRTIVMKRGTKGLFVERSGE